MIPSPRSIEACKIEGIEEKELLKKPMEDIQDELIPPQFAEQKELFWDLKFTFYEHTRQKKVEQCIQVFRKSTFWLDNHFRHEKS